MSHIRDLSLAEFIVARKEYCRIKHSQSKCNLCAPLITFANELLEHGVVPLSECFRKIFSQEYKSEKAIRRIMQLPIVVFRVNQKLFVAEYSPDMNYEKFMKFFNLLVPDKTMAKGISRETLKMLCDLSSSEKDKKLIRFAASSHISATKAKKELGISDLVKLRKEVADAVEQYRDIRDAVDEVVRVRERLSLKELGIILSETEDEVDSSDNETSIDKTTLPSKVMVRMKLLQIQSQITLKTGFLLGAYHCIQKMLKQRLRNNETFFGGKRGGELPSLFVNDHCWKEKNLQG